MGQTKTVAAGDAANGDAIGSIRFNATYVLSCRRYRLLVSNGRSHSTCFLSLLCWREGVKTHLVRTCCQVLQQRREFPETGLKLWGCIHFTLPTEGMLVGKVYELRWFGDVFGLRTTCLRKLLSASHDLSCAMLNHQNKRMTVNFA